MLHDIKADATVVGVPGRVVGGTDSPGHEKRQAVAQKMGFDAYGTTSDMPDPVATAVNRILDHIHVMDQRLEDVCKGLKSLGAEVADLQMPELDSVELGGGAAGGKKLVDPDDCAK